MEFEKPVEEYLKGRMNEAAERRFELYLQGNPQRWEELKSARNRRISNAINSLSEKYRTQLILRHMQGLSLAEIAESQNVSIRTVANRLHRAHKLLREALAKL